MKVSKVSKPFDKIPPDCFVGCRPVGRAYVQRIFISIRTEARRQYGSLAAYVRACNDDGLPVKRETINSACSTGDVLRVPFLVIAYHLNKLNITLLDALTKY